MSFGDDAKRLIKEKVDLESLNILVWGSGKVAGSGLEKRKEIKKRLQAVFKESDVKFSEDLSRDPELKSTPLGSKDLHPHQQELWHLALCDICIVLDVSKGPGEEIAHFVGSRHAYKLLVFTPDEYKKSRSFAASLRKATNQQFYSPEEFNTCNLIERIITHVRHVALAKAISISPA